MPALGHASINDTYYCHEGKSPTCYELATRRETRRMVLDVEEKSGHMLDLPPTEVMHELLGEHADTASQSTA